LNDPAGIGLQSNGNIVVSESGNHRISVFDSMGNFIKIIGVGELQDPHHLFIDSDDNILVADQSNRRIVIFSSQTGILLKSLQTEDSVEDLYGITMDRDGRIVVSGSANKVVIY